MMRSSQNRLPKWDWAKASSKSNFLPCWISSVMARQETIIVTYFASRKVFSKIHPLCAVSIKKEKIVFWLSWVKPRSRLVELLENLYLSTSYIVVMHIRRILQWHFQPVLFDIFHIDLDTRTANMFTKYASSKKSLKG